MVDIFAEIENYIVEKRKKEVTPPFGFYFPIPGKYSVSELSLATCLRNLIWRRQISMNEFESVLGEKLKEFPDGEKILLRKERMTLPKVFPKTTEELYRREISLMREREVNHIVIRYFASIIGRKTARDIANGKPTYFSIVPIKSYEFTPYQAKPSKISITLITPLGISTIDDEYIQIFAVKGSAFTGWTDKVTGELHTGTADEPYPFHVEIANASAIINELPRFRIVYVNQETYDTAEHHKNIDRELFKAILDRAWYVYWSEQHGQIHRKIMTMKVEEWQCRKCPFFEACPSRIVPKEKMPEELPKPRETETTIPEEFFGPTSRQEFEPVSPYFDSSRYNYSKFGIVDTGGLGI
jgi:hypothetical protein